MWLARDKSGELFVFYETKPYKDEDRGFWFNEGGMARSTRILVSRSQMV